MSKTLYTIEIKQSNSVYVNVEASNEKEAFIIVDEAYHAGKYAQKPQEAKLEYVLVEPVLGQA